MYRTAMPVGDLHAVLWPMLCVHSRHVDGLKDVTVGDHPDLGLCVVSHRGLEDRIEWFTSRPMQAPHQQGDFNLKINDMTLAEVTAELRRIADREQVGQAAEVHVGRHPTRGYVVVVIEPGKPERCKLIEIDHDDFEA